MHTDDLDGRLAAHWVGAYDGYTAKRRPFRLIYQDTFGTREEAFAAERQLKGWSKAKRLALARGDWTAVQRLSLRHSPQPGRGVDGSAAPSRTSG
ncbi:MAG: GIY-YIG nuclease family protein [Chloroflexota bacterium]